MGDIDSVKQAHEQLKHWRDALNDWIYWLDSEIAAISSGNPPNRTLTLLLQHISLLRPWFRGLINVLPQKTPENIPVTRCDYQEPRFIGWPQRITRGSHTGGEKADSV